MKKIKDKALSMNLKKGILRFIVCGVVLTAVFSVVLFQRFGNRLEELRTAVETEGNYENDYEQSGQFEDASDGRKKNLRMTGTDEQSGQFEDASDGRKKGRDREKEEDGGHELKLALQTLHFSSGDVALLGISVIMVLLMAVWYLVLCMAWAYQKSCRMGQGSTAWVIAALFFHLAAIIILYLYAGVKGVCANCGKVIRGGDRFCDRCGTILKKECPHCGQTVDAGVAYCGGCGRKLDEEPSGESGEAPAQA